MSTLRVNTIQNQAGTGQPSISGLAQAWVNFNGTGTPAIRASLSVTSITDNGTGNYAINLTNSMGSTSYAPVLGHGFASDETGYTYGCCLPISATQVRVNIARDGVGEADTSWVQVAVFR